MQIAGVLVLEPSVGWDVAAASELAAQRLARVPRLRQRLVRAPVGCGRAHWVDDPAFDPHRHVDVIRCPAPGDEAALLSTTLALVARRLPRARPLWSATFVCGLEHGRIALVVVLHHVVADGLGGLAMLAGLVDGGSEEGPGELRPPRAAPSRRELAFDAWTDLLGAPARVPAQLRRLRAAVAELGASRPAAAPHTSLNRPTGSRRAIRVVSLDLASVVQVAHAHGATVNDVVLTAVAGALAALLAGRGETLPRLVVSVPVSARAATGPVEVGNQVGAVPVSLPTGGRPDERLAAVAAITRAHKTQTPGASAALLQPVFRTLAAAGLLGWFVNHQRLVNTFVTNLRGPADPMTFMRAPVTAVIPVSGIQGNATVAFAVLSYAGALTITVMVDPDVVQELLEIITALRAELGELTGAG